METASFAGTIKVIFYIILFYYIFKFLMRILLPVLLKKAVEKAGENFRQQQYQAPFNPSQNGSSQTTFTNTNPKSDKPRETKKVGEYVDFEEIE